MLIMLPGSGGADDNNGAIKCFAGLEVPLPIFRDKYLEDGSGRESEPRSAGVAECPALGVCGNEVISAKLPDRLRGQRVDVRLPDPSQRIDELRKVGLKLSVAN